MDASVVICTYNRCRSLRRTLQSLQAMSVPASMNWELLVVDNNSTDATKQTVEEIGQNSCLPIRYIFEQRQGLSYARNAAVAVARAEFIAFTDDDVLVDRQWLVELKEGFSGGADCVGGKILPIWSEARPVWLTHDLEGNLALVDYGENAQEIKRSHHLLYGANLAFRKCVFARLSFDTRFGPKGKKLYNNDETTMILSIIRSDGQVRYQPTAVVYHVIEPQRVKKSYFRKWHFDNGEGRGLALGFHEGRTVFSVPLYSIRELLESVFTWLRKGIRRGGFRDELYIWSSVGFIWGRLKYHFGI
jgi:glycosyltransferase involved in cell wall biosynthesis